MAAASPGLNCNARKMVTDFPVRTICMVSSMIASWFSIARKCEELPLQRDVWPTSTNPQLMASRSNRPQQPHILQRLHVHNSFARLKTSECQFVKIHNQSCLQEEREKNTTICIFSLRWHLRKLWFKCNGIVRMSLGKTNFESYNHPVWN